MIVRVWRIVKAARAEGAFDGEGARMFGGRWNSRGTRMVYASATLSLAALETLAHINPRTPLPLVAICAEFDSTLADRPGALPTGWDARPPGAVSQRLGDAWVEGGRTAVLEVPSVIVPQESNFLLNPAHPDFPSIRIGTPRPFVFDARLGPSATA